MGTALVHIALVAYLAAGASYLTWLLRPRDWLVSLGRAALSVGLVLHLGAFAVGQLEPSRAGIWRGGQLFSLLAGALVAVYLLLDLRYRLPVAGGVAGPLAGVGV